MPDDKLREAIARIAHKIMYPNQYVHKSFPTVADQHKVADDAKEELVQLFATYLQAAVRATEPKIEIKAKLQALDKLIMSAGEYHDDPHEYVVPLRHIQEYRANLQQFDLTQPIFKEQQLNQGADHEK